MIELLNVDCMDYMAGLPDNAFDLAIVDPPYGIGLDMVYDHGTIENTFHKNNDWNDKIPSPEYFEQLHRVSKHQIIFGCNYYAKYIPAVGRIVHDKQLQIEGTALKYSEADLASCSLQKGLPFFAIAGMEMFREKLSIGKTRGRTPEFTRRKNLFPFTFGFYTTTQNLAKGFWTLTGDPCPRRLPVIKWDLTP